MYLILQSVPFNKKLQKFGLNNINSVNFIFIIRTIVWINISSAFKQMKLTIYISQPWIREIRGQGKKIWCRVGGKRNVKTFKQPSGVRFSRLFHSFLYIFNLKPNFWCYFFFFSHSQASFVHVRIILSKFMCFTYYEKNLCSVIVYVKIDLANILDFFFTPF